MGLFEILSLFVLMAALALVPGTGVALVVVRSSTSGFLSGAAVAAGIVLGDLVFVFLALLGMTALAEVMGGLFVILRVVAGAYLIWIGVSLMRSRPSLRFAVQGGSVATLSASVLSGLAITLGDVKAIFFYASLFPVFVDLAAVHTSDIAVITVLTVVAVGGVKLGYAYAATKVMPLAAGIRGERGTRVAAGGLMIGAGTYMITRA